MNETIQETLVTSAALAAKTYEARAYAAASASSPLAPTTIRRRAPGPTGRADRGPLLRGLPLGPAPGPERVAEDHADRLSLCSGSRDRRPCGRGGRGRPEVQGR